MRVLRFAGPPPFSSPCRWARLHRAGRGRAPDYWPREIRTKDGSVITIFQPQVEKFVGIQVTARSAMSIKLVSRKDPVFGAVWFVANVDIDRDAGTVTRS